MRSFVRITAVFALLLAVVTTVAAQEEKGKKKKKGAGGVPAPVAQLQSKLDSLELTDEQKGKIKEIVEKHTAKIAEAQKVAGSILTPEQRKARQEAAAKAKADGKKGKEAQDAIAAALNLSAEDKAKLETANKEAAEAVAALRNAVSEVLTDEQKAKAGLNAPMKGKKKKKGQ